MANNTFKNYTIYSCDVDDQFPNEQENIEAYIEFCEMNDIEIEDKNNINEDDLREFLEDTNNEYWDTMISEVDFYENKHGCNMCVIQGDMGLWNGRRTGYHITNNLSNALSYGEGERDVYIENNKLMIKINHHDGTNYHHIRVLTKMGVNYYHNHIDDVNTSNYELMEHIFNSNRLSKEVRVFHDIYGWK